MTTAVVLALSIAFGDPPTATVEYGSVVELLPPRPDCRADDPRTTAWLVANVLALRIDCRGHPLTRPNIDQDVAARLRLENLHDAKAMFRALELIREWDAERPPLFVRR